MRNLNDETSICKLEYQDRLPTNNHKSSLAAALMNSFCKRIKNQRLRKITISSKWFDINLFIITSNTQFKRYFLSSLNRHQISSKFNQRGLLLQEQLQFLYMVSNTTNYLLVNIVSRPIGTSISRLPLFTLKLVSTPMHRNSLENINKATNFKIFL